MAMYRIAFTIKGNETEHIVTLDLNAVEMQGQDKVLFRSIGDAREKAFQKLNNVYGNIAIKSIEELTE